MASPDQDHTLAPEQNASSSEISPGSSTNPSRGSSRPRRERHRVRFTPGGESIDESNQRSLFEVRDENSPLGGGLKPMPRARRNSGHSRSSSSTSVPHLVDSNITRDITDSRDKSSAPKGRPPILRAPSSSESEMDNVTTELSDDIEAHQAKEKAFSQQSARERAERLNRRLVGSRSAPGSKIPSPIRKRSRSPSPSQNLSNGIDLDSIPLQKLHTTRKYGIEDETEDEDDDDEHDEKPSNKIYNRFQLAARRLVRYHSRKDKGKEKNKKKGKYKLHRVQAPLASGQTTPNYDRDQEEYVPRPKEYREGFLSSILKLYNEEGVGSALSNIPSGLDALKTGKGNQSKESLLASGATSASNLSPVSSGASSPTRTKRPKWYKNTESSSTGSIANLISSSTVLAQPAGSSHSPNDGPTIRPKTKARRNSGNALETILAKAKGPRSDQSVRIQVHIAQLFSRQKFVLKMTKALMSYGAPTHRLEGV